MKISYGITVCNEHKELKHLINFLNPIIDDEDEIVIVYDQNRVTKEVHQVLEEYNDLIKHYPFNFQQNFLENKNYMNTKCNGDYIFQIDADEIPQEFLVENIKEVLKSNSVDVLIVPRKNLVEGLTQEHINKYRWNVNEKGWVNWPDAQKRIYKNTPEILWTGHQIHGMVTGYKTWGNLPMEEEWSISHNKTINRQESQNDRYNQIELGQLKSI